jgi:hypothetical protein
MGLSLGDDDDDDDDNLYIFLIWDISENGKVN